jgi:hypothetical protein
MWIIKCSINGDIIDRFESRETALQTIREYEEQDKADEAYEKGFYELGYEYTADEFHHDCDIAEKVMDQFWKMNSPLMMESLIGVLTDIASSKSGESPVEIYERLSDIAPKVEEMLGKIE